MYEFPVSWRQWIIVGSLCCTLVSLLFNALYLYYFNLFHDEMSIGFLSFQCIFCSNLKTGINPQWQLITFRLKNLNPTQIILPLCYFLYFCFIVLQWYCWFCEKMLLLFFSLTFAKRNFSQLVHQEVQTRKLVMIHLFARGFPSWSVPLGYFFIYLEMHTGLENVDLRSQSTKYQVRIPIFLSMQ